MNVISLVAIGVIGAILALIVKQYRPEYSMMISLLASVILLFNLIEFVSPLILEIKELMQDVNVSYNYIFILIKAVGICYLVQFACDVCRDAGQNAICSKIELAGKIGVCAIALPLYKDLLDVVRTIIGKVA